MRSGADRSLVAEPAARRARLQRAPARVDGARVLLGPEARPVERDTSTGRRVSRTTAAAARDGAAVARARLGRSLSLLDLFPRHHAAVLRLLRRMAGVSSAGARDARISFSQEPRSMSTSVGRAPPAELFAKYPASWYLFGAGADLARGPVSKSMLGRRIVAFRTQSGRAIVMDGNCAHLGADLGCGKVVGETIQCPFHGWRYGADGICKHAPVAAFASPRPRSSVPPFARLQTYPAVERHGYLFFFNGREPLFPLPFFWGEEPDRFVAGRIFTYTADCNWY